MRYIIADKTLADSQGFPINTHRVNGNQIILNEKEVYSILPGNTLEDKIGLISGTIYTHAEINKIINKGGWNE